MRLQGLFTKGRIEVSLSLVHCYLAISLLSYFITMAVITHNYSKSVGVSFCFAITHNGKQLFQCQP